MIPILKNEWGMSDNEVSLQTSVIFLGFVVGSMLSGYFADKYGRKRPFLFSMSVTIGVTFVTAFA